MFRHSHHEESSIVNLFVVFSSVLNLFVVFSCSHPVESSVVFPVSIGPGRSVSSTTGAILEMCILCQESQEIRHHERAMVLAGFIQR